MSTLPMIRTEAKPIAVRKGVGTSEKGEAQALDQLENDTKLMDMENVLRARGAHHAVTDLYPHHHHHV